MSDHKHVWHIPPADGSYQWCACGLKRHNDAPCVVCREPFHSRAHADINPRAIRGMWDIPHHKYEGQHE